VDQESVSATLTVAVPATRVFAVLADPTTHSAIDGTGWVQEAADRAPLTEVGQVFRVDMYHPGHPNGDYQVVNKVQVLDPPRAGLTPDAIAALVKAAPARITYVSCEPPTLARDLKAFCAAGYAIAEIQLFDLFPQTFHMETVVKLHRRS